MGNFSDNIRCDLRLRQIQIVNHIVTTDTHDFSHIKTIAGADISWINETGGREDNKGVAIIVVLEYPSMRLIHQELNEFTSDIPYLSGYLGFREIPQYRILWERVTRANIHPDLILVDGFGILHPAGCGSSSMLGVELDVPTIGIGKTINLGGCDKNDKEIKRELIDSKALEIPLLKNGKITGRAIRKSLDHRQPIYVSIGHKISLETAVEIVKKCMINKIPEPIRQADLISREYIRKNI